MNNSKNVSPPCKPAITEEMLSRWQTIVDSLARIVGVSAGLIMKMDPPQIEVLVASATEGNPYEQGERADLNAGLYCEAVMAQRSPLLVPDALKDPDWDHNPDIKQGMISYLGFPLQWPDGEIFGTICVLDSKENQYSKAYVDLMSQFKELVEAQLDLSYTRQHLEDLVEDRTAELKDAKEQLQQNLAKIEQATHELEKRLQFEQMASELSSEFINLPPDQIDSKINDGLKLIAETLDIDRTLLHEFSGDRQHLRVSHFFGRPGIQAPTSIMTSVGQPWFTKTILNSEIIRVESISNLPQEAKLEREYLMQQGVKSGLAIPLVVGSKPVGALTFTTVFRERSWPDELVQRLVVISEVIANALDRKQKEQKLANAFSEIKELKDRLEQENIYLHEEIRMSQGHEKILGQSDAILKVLGQAEQVAQTGSSVLILGETGTGKELLAHMIHNLSSRKDRPMIKVNCTALPATLIESELFGREKGAYTGALTRQVGRFEVAHGSSIFLDEISELPLELQAKLLRVLQDGTFERLGSSKTVSVDVRVIAATNRDLEKAMEEGRFREDLYYRLNVFPITLPPLRERREDIPLLVWAFTREFGETMGKSIEQIPRRAMEALQRYHWPGNVRELRNIIERGVILGKGKTLIVQMPNDKASKRSPLTLADVERKHIMDVLESRHWRVYGKTGAAEVLGLKPSTLQSRMKKLEIKRP